MQPLPLVVFGEDWGRHPSTAQYLALELLDTRHITWVNSIGLREPSFSLADLGRIAGKVHRALRPADTDDTTVDTDATEVREPHSILSPWIVPLHRHSWARHLNASLFGRQFRRQTALGPGEFDVITANPASYYLLDALKPRHSLYYCADKYAQIAGLNPELVDRFERELLERVDTVVATSLPLVEDLGQLHNSVRYLPHGVDYALLQSDARNYAAPALTRRPDHWLRWAAG